jgi:hypothetical protein
MFSIKLESSCQIKGLERYMLEIEGVEGRSEVWVMAHLVSQ